MKSGLSSVAIERDLVRRVIRYASEAHPQECCGLLFGDAKRIDAAECTQNMASQPLTHFEIDPARLIAAERAARKGGAAIAGYFHSHPNGLPQPSRTDAGMAAPDGRLWLIVAGERITVWRAVERGTLHGRFDPVELVTIESGLAPGRADRH